MKTSKRRQLASRANAAKSTGPRTPEGKARSSYNALRHGMLSKCVVLACENKETFEKLLQHFVRRFEPLDDVEFGMIEEMAACHWRMRRGWVAETELMNQAVEKHNNGARSAETCIAAAITDLAATPQLALLNRYEGRLNRMYQRALRNLLLLREQKAAAAQTPAETKAETKEDTPVEIHEIEKDRTKLIPKMNTLSDPAAGPDKPSPGPSRVPESRSPDDRAA